MPTAAVTAAAGGVLSALPYMLLAHGALSAMVLAYFSQLPLFAVGLSLGLQFGAVAAAIGMVGVGIVAGVEAGAVFGASNAIPVTLMLNEGMRSAGRPGGRIDIGRMVVAASALAVVGFGLAVLSYADEPDGLQGAIRAQLEQMAALLGADGGVQISAALEARTQDFPAFVGASWVIMLAINMILAQRLVERFGSARYPSPDYRSLQLPDWLWIPVGLSGALMVLGDETLSFYGRNLFALTALPYFFQGVATVHVVARRLAQPLVLLIVFYFLLLWFLWHGLFIVAVLGLVDQWKNLRRIAAPQARISEDE